jgi:hypothetical protein
MTLWTPDWSLTINGSGEYANLTLSNLTTTSGRTDIYTQAYAGYCNFQIINLNQATISLDVNDQILLKVKNESGVDVNVFGGYITDIDVEVVSSGTAGVNEVISVTALGALSKLPKTLYTTSLAKDFDGDQIYQVLSQALFSSWNEVPSATTWATYDASTTWANAENSGLGEIDLPGNYELASRAANTTDVYSLATALANSGLGYLYEDAQGRIGYADSTHRSQYLAANGYVELNANDALAAGIKTSKRSGDIRNTVNITYKNNQQTSASDLSSIALYGEQAYNIETSLENLADATAQANFYLTLRAFPEAQFRSITFPLHSPELSGTIRNALLNVFMGMPVNLTNLPSNINAGTFQGFVEGWTFTTTYNGLYLTLMLSPVSYSLQAFRWNDVPAVETWNSIIPTLEWLDATIVA